jgi:Ca2+-binding EF-hand superfamily protein
MAELVLDEEESYHQHSNLTITDLYLQNEPVDPSQDDRLGISKAKRFLLQQKLGKDTTIVAIIHGLKGDLSQYNGCIAQPQETERAGYFILNGVTRFNNSRPLEISLSLGELNLMATEMHLGCEEDNNAERATDANVITQGNRGDAVLTYTALRAQLRGVMKAAVKKGTSLKMLFSKFDSNNNGTLSKEELKIGCAELNIKLSTAEMRLLWPYLDANGDGSIDLQEFLHFADSSRGEDSAAQSDMKEIERVKEVGVRHISKEQRQKRIAVKTFHIEYLERTLQNLHQQIKAWAQKTGKTQEQLFQEFDEDNSNSISAKEMYRGLRRSGFEVSQGDIRALWVVLSDAALNNSEVNLSRWRKFLRETTVGIKNRFKMTQDEFQHLFPDYVPPTAIVRPVATKKKSRARRYPLATGARRYPLVGIKTDRSVIPVIDASDEVDKHRPITRRASVLLWEQRILHGTKKGDHNHRCRKQFAANMMWQNKPKTQMMYHPDTNAVVDSEHEHPSHHWHDGDQASLIPSPQPKPSQREASNSMEEEIIPATRRRSLTSPTNSRKPKLFAPKMSKSRKKEIMHRKKEFTEQKNKLTEVRAKQRAMLASLESQRSRLNRLNGFMCVPKKADFEGEGLDNRPSLSLPSAT